MRKRIIIALLAIAVLSLTSVLVKKSYGRKELAASLQPCDASRAGYTPATVHVLGSQEGKVLFTETRYIHSNGDRRVIKDTGGNREITYFKKEDGVYQDVGGRLYYQSADPHRCYPPPTPEEIEAYKSRTTPDRIAGYDVYCQVLNPEGGTVCRAPSFNNEIMRWNLAASKTLVEVTSVTEGEPQDGEVRLPQVPIDYSEYEHGHPGGAHPSKVTP